MFAEIESGVRNDIYVRKELPSKAFSRPPDLTVSSTYTATNMNFIAEPYGAPVTLTPPEPMQHPKSEYFST